MRERCYWCFVNTSEENSLFKYILLPVEWLVWCLLEFANMFCRDSTGADFVCFNKKGMITCW